LGEEERVRHTTGLGFCHWSMPDVNGEKKRSDASVRPSLTTSVIMIMMGSGCDG